MLSILLATLLLQQAVGISIRTARCDTTGECNQDSKDAVQVKENRLLAANFIKQLRKVVCPDESSECPDGKTCCKLKPGHWGCCPFPKAVCCSDHEHCCPDGYTCNLLNRTCSRGLNKVKIFSKAPSRQINPLRNVICPDGSKCPDGNTCCKLSSNRWGCCPFPKAVCCSDHEHCCPDGYTCNLSTGTCSRGLKKVKMFLKTPSLQPKSNLVCPDGQSECPNGDTCCKLKDGTYGCCPLAKAVCCSDGEHCCPEGSVCRNGSCYRGLDKMETFSNKFALKVRSVVCPGGVQQCPDENTCCRKKKGYGCCPLKDAVCCSDSIHCCPKGFKCDIPNEKCINGTHSDRIFVKTPAVPVAGRTLCPDNGQTCADSETCCKIPGKSTYGCCPFKKGTCCGSYCCPPGFLCSFTGHKCVRVPFLSWIFAKRYVHV